MSSATNWGETPWSFFVSRKGFCSRAKSTWTGIAHRQSRVVAQCHPTQPPHRNDSTLFDTPHPHEINALRNEIPRTRAAAPTRPGTGAKPATFIKSTGCETKPLHLPSASTSAAAAARSAPHRHISTPRRQWNQRSAKRNPPPNARHPVPLAKFTENLPPSATLPF